MKPFIYARVFHRPNTCEFAFAQACKSSRVSRSSSRAFHATPRRPIFGECLIQTHTVINSLHEITGLPWAASISLIGLGVAVVVHLPIALYCASIRRRQNEQGPELAKYRDSSQWGIKRDFAGKDASYKERRVQKVFAAHCHQLWKEKGIQHWKMGISFARYSIWFIIMDCLRRMTGIHEDFPSLVWQSFTGRQGLDQTLDDSVVHVEPTLAMEGAMWFPNLILPDPSLVLPFVLSASIFACNYSGFGVMRAIYLMENSAEGFLRVTRFNVRMYRLRNILTLMIGPATLQFPSALLVFWISHSLSALVIGHLWS